MRSVSSLFEICREISTNLDPEPQVQLLHEQLSPLQAKVTGVREIWETYKLSSTMGTNSIPQSNEVLTISQLCDREESCFGVSR